MPKKLFISILVVLFAVPLYFQIHRVNAEHDPLTHPLTPPVTSPETPTPTEVEPSPTLTLTPTTIPSVTPTTIPSITPTPTEEPEDEGTITGKVIYRRLGRLTVGPRASDAAGVDVVAETFFGGDEVDSDTTDSNGMYAMDVPPGLYKVTVEDEDDTFFVPPLHIVNVKSDKEKNANFQGLVFP